MLAWTELSLLCQAGFATLIRRELIEKSFETFTTVVMEPPPSSLSIGDEEEDKEQTMRGSKQSIEEKKDLASSSEQTLPNRQCRICYAPEEASGADPILLLGCMCKGDISYSHQSCLKKWFHMRFWSHRNLDCEVCRRPLGARVEKIIRSFITAEIVQHAPRLLLLLQIPPHDLDDLQVPLETPGFYQLPSETRRSLEASFERLEQEQRRGQSRRREVFETAQFQSTPAAAADREPSEAVLQNQGGDLLTSLSRLEDMLLNDVLELREVHIRPPFVRVFTAHPDPHIPTYDVPPSNLYLEGPVLRVPILGPEDRFHPSPVEDLLDEVSRHAVRMVDLYGEDLILFPNFMDNLFLEVDVEELPRMSADGEVHDNVVDDDIPVASPVLINPTSGDPDPVFAEAAARPTDSIPSRAYTYGRFQVFQLLQ